MITAPPGVYVLGMHRSGTSVLAGVLDLLGLDAGDRTDLLTADEFNSDGYWERRSVVEWHDAALRRLRGWASAPPPPVMLNDRRLAGMVEGIEPLLGPYHRPWFIKDPRQCLLLPLWHRARGDSDLSLIVARSAVDVQRSLINRNRYTPELAIALWERYTYDLLRSLRGRRALVVRYDALTSRPDVVVEQLLAALDRHVPGGAESLRPDIDAAIDLIRIRPTDTTRSDELLPEQRALEDQLMSLTGEHDAVELGSLALSGRTRDLFGRRRRWLNCTGWLVRANMDARARLDRVPILRG